MDSTGDGGDGGGGGGGGDDDDALWNQRRARSAGSPSIFPSFKNFERMKVMAVLLIDTDPSSLAFLVSVRSRV